MSLRISNLFALFFILLIGISCAEDPIESEELPEENVVRDERLEELDTFVELFIEEGRKRGTSLNADDLTLHFVDKFSTSDNVAESTCGLAWWDFRETGQRRVEILDTDGCWHTKSNLEKENFMFHELGHALLSLRHSFGRFPNGSPNSIMCSRSSSPGINNCISNYEVYHQTKEMRDYYLDQLFDSRTSSPSWIKNSFNHGSIFPDSITKNDAEWSNQVIDWDNWETDDIKSDFTFSVTSDGSSDHELKIDIANDIRDEALGLFTTVIERANITDCHAIKVEFDYTRSENLDGDIQVWIGIHREEENGDFNTFKLHEEEFPAVRLESSGKLNAEIYCVPEETNYVTVSLVFKPSSNGTVTFSNIEVSQYD